MRHPLDHQLSLPITTKQQWLKSIQAALHRKKLHKYGNIAAEQRLMEMWVIQTPQASTSASNPKTASPTTKKGKEYIYTSMILHSQ